MLTSDGAITLSCLTTFVTPKGSENSQSFCTRACMPSWNCRTIVMNVGGQPNLAMIFQSPSRLTVSVALVRLTNVMYRSTLCSLHFSWSRLAVKIMSIVPVSILNPYWLSGICPFWFRWTFRRFNRLYASIFPLVDRREMPLWLSQTWGYPFRLYRWIMDASLNSYGISSFLHIQWNNFVSFFAMGSPQAPRL